MCSHLVWPMISFVPQGREGGQPCRKRSLLLPVPTNNSSPSVPWKPVVLCFGLGLFLASFFLPAVDEWKGWECAQLAFLTWNDDKFSRLSWFGGIINPLAVLYVFLSALPGTDKIRAYLSSAILFCIPLTWFALDRMNVQVKVGHFAWIAGVLLMLSPVISRIPQLPGAKWLAATAFIVFSYLGIPRAISATMHLPTARDDFFYVVAWNFKEPAVCQKIDSNAIGREDQRDDHDLTYMRSDCYRNIAAMLNTPELCDNVRSASLDRLVGSLVARWNCRGQRYTWGTASPADGNHFVEMMRAAGYGDEQLSHLIYERNPNNRIYNPHPTGEEYWDYFWYLATEDTSARSRFLSRVMTLK
jgi:hypothetical protein